MASNNCFIVLAIFMAISLSSMEFGLAARHLMQTNPTVPGLPALPPLPTIPSSSLPKPTLPTLPTVPQATLPPIPTSLPNIPSIPNIPINFPAIPFLSPPPSSTTP